MRREGIEEEIGEIGGIGARDEESRGKECMWIVGGADWTDDGDWRGVVRADWTSVPIGCEDDSDWVCESEGRGKVYAREDCVNWAGIPTLSADWL